MIQNSPEISDTILKRDNFKCQKCDFADEFGEDLKIHKISPQEPDNPDNFVTLCSVCSHFAPENKEELMAYLKEKIDGNILKTFRKTKKSISKRTTKGMLTQFNQGQHITKAPKGYKIINKRLVIDPIQAEEVRKIFEDFSNSDISLTQLGKKYGLTTSGVIKLIKNTTYLGMVKFAEQESKGNHEPIVTEELFSKANSKLSG